MGSTNEREDIHLLQAIASGDGDAVTEFYQRHEDRVYRFILSKVSDTFAAADILNDVMLDVWRSAHRFQGRAKVTTWLLGIAHNKVIDHWRRQGRREFTELDDAMPDDADNLNPEEVITSASDGKVLHACLQKLKPEHREILHLVFFEELNYGEIAEIINVPQGTVKSRVFHARSLMKKHLAQAARA